MERSSTNTPPASPMVTARSRSCPGWMSGLIHFTNFGIGIQPRADQRALVGVIGVPVVAGEMLIVPDELPGLGVERDGRVAVKIRRRACGRPRRGCRCGAPQRWSGMGFATPQ